MYFSQGHFEFRRITLLRKFVRNFLLFKLYITGSAFLFLHLTDFVNISFLFLPLPKFLNVELSK